MIETHATSAYNYPLLIKHLLHTPLASTPEQEIVSGKTRYTYLGFAQRIKRLAGGLASIGVTRGDTVAVMDFDNHRYLECFFAIPMMGAVLHTINIRLSPEQILYTINHAEDDVILVHADFLPIVEQIRDRFERPTKLIYLKDGEAPEKPDYCVIEYEAMLEATDGEFEFEDFDENTSATTFYTTGTTGDPKGVFYSHRQLVLHTLAILAGIGSGSGSTRFHRGDVYMPITPMFHVHAWGFPYAATLMGVKQVYPGRYEPSVLLSLIERENVTFSHCVPTILHMLLSAQESKQTDLSRWKVIIGGSALSEGLARTALEMGINIYTGYGMSEACPILSIADLSGVGTVTSDDETITRRCKTGQPFVMVDLRVVDSNMDDRPHDNESTGEVVVRAPWLTQGYTRNPEGSEELWQGGYMHTGDVGYIDETGSLKITDRMKDIIKSGGEWISSLELENIVSRCAGVSEVAAIGIEDERWGERPMLIVVKTTDDQSGISIESIQQTVRGEVDKGILSKWAIPDRIEFVDEIPKTSVGKLDKKVLRVMYDDNQS